MAGSQVGSRGRWGNVIEMPTTAPHWNKEVQRAEGDGSGSPVTNTETTLAVVPGSQTRYLDTGEEAALDGSKVYIYRYRMVRTGAQDGAWSSWTAEQSPSNVVGQPKPPKDARAFRRGTDGDAGSDNDLMSEIMRQLNSQGNSVSGFLVGGFSPGRHITPGTARDIDATGASSVSFSQDYDTVPKFAFVPQVGRVYSQANSASDQRVDMKAQDPAVSGFDLKAKVITAKNFSSQTDGFSASRNASSPENSDVTLSSDGDIAYSNLEDANANSATYVAFFDITQPSSLTDPPSSMTVKFEYSSAATGGSWTTGALRGYSSGSNLNDETLSFTATLGANYDVRLRIVGANVNGNFTCVAHGEDNTEPGVQWERDDGTTSVNMTPDSNDRVLYLPIDAEAP